MPSYDDWKTNPGPQYDPAPLDIFVYKAPYYGTEKACGDCEEVADYYVEISLPLGPVTMGHYCHSHTREIEAEYTKENKKNV